MILSNSEAKDFDWLSHEAKLISRNHHINDIDGKEEKKEESKADNEWGEQDYSRYKNHRL